ncbi:NirD/YgiW/YdeI family stress tolerance protein [Agarivorans sp. B2Z047]|uniref:YgiW/YdeI family stress tolerance OB fold protein n=1 Tax=Agarivorans sp. B2Z047 TaxID=2652721 RepID=UPI00128D98FD|nr:NirD/YgiW/YdeI family stress tolerance protein [Agarivorans sp. B2Z047]MPW31901.1 NirD/YgiW/YdeI family stress tolerance protein [Agarivorans sp. B2Z047]UQN40984.1 NirD/YgiW/YdeI family stress tolerance protein [Agarivorans sp. B2Z047]
MKKVLFASVLLLNSNTVFAAFNGPQAQGINTVSAALEARDDSYVELTGNIVKSLGNDMYLFKDQTGEIQIEIDSDVWMGQDITPEDKVIIRGEVDLDWTTREIDVDAIRKL